MCCDFSCLPVNISEKLKYFIKCVYLSELLRFSIEFVF